MSFPQEFFDYLNNHSLIGVKGGITRPTFLDIWMVHVNGRVFSRSWDKSARSWFTACIETGLGEIKFGDSVIRVSARKLTDEPETTALINQAYLSKYNQPHNILELLQRRSFCLLCDLFSSIFVIFFAEYTRFRLQKMPQYC